MLALVLGAVGVVVMIRAWCRRIVSLYDTDRNWDIKCVRFEMLRYIQSRNYGGTI